MGQFDNIIPVKVTLGKTVTTASIRAPKKPVAVDKAGNEIKKESDIHGGGARTQMSVQAGDKVRTTEGRLRTPRKVGLAKPSAPEVRTNGATKVSVAVGAGLEDPKSSRNVKEEANLETTTMRLNKEGKAYDSDTGAHKWPKVQGNTKIRLGGQQFLDDKGSNRGPTPKGAEQQLIPTTANDKTGSGTSKVTGQTPIMDTPKKYVEHDIPEVAYNEKGKVSGSWDDPTSILSTTMREEDAGPAVKVGTVPVRSGTSSSKYVKPEVKDTRAGQKFPIESLNTDWNDTKTSRGPRRGAHELNLNEEAQVKVPGQTAAQQRADMSRAATRTSAPARELGYDTAKVHQHALTMAIRDNVSLGDMSSDSFKHGYHHTKAIVMALGDMHPSDEGRLNKHLGTGSEHENNLKTLHEHLTSRNRFNETSKPGKGTEYSSARGNVDVTPASKDYYVPKGSSSLVHASKLGDSSLEGSTVPFEGYIPNTGSDKESTPYHAVNTHQGYHPDEETHPVTGERIRVFRHHDVPQGAIHVGDVAEEAMKSGKSMYRYEKQVGIQRNAAKGPSEKSRKDHGNMTRYIIDQHREAEAAARLPQARPEGGEGQVTRGVAGSPVRKTEPMTEKETDLARSINASQSEGKFIEVGTAQGLKDKYKVKDV
jgi:hypothetical protein